MAFKWDEQKLDKKEKSNKVTFSKQGDLPRLPVLNLKNTATKALQWIQPLVDPATFADSQRKWKQFVEGDGEKLQKALQKWADQAVLPSWLEPFWDDGYLRARCPIVMNVNFGLCVRSEKLGSGDWVTIAANLAYGVTQMHLAIQREAYPVDEERGKPLCMLQYSRVFGTCRIPEKDIDKWRSPPAIDPSKHIIVLNKGQIYYMDVLDSSGAPISIAEIQKALRAVVTKKAEGVRGVGVLTGLNRNSWAEIRNAMIRHNTDNLKCFSIIETALFALALDDQECPNPLERTRHALHGDPKNRWYDKCFTVCVARDGTVAINGEHSWGDATTVMATLDFAAKAQGAVGVAAATSPPTKCEPVRFTLSPHLTNVLSESEKEVSQTIQNVSIQVVEGTFGSDLAKKAGVSPDGVAQACWIATQYRAWGRCYSVYESAMTKMFLHGRTEAMRSVTQEMVDFAQALTQEPKSPANVQKLQAACEMHVKRMNECKDGSGVDRHLYGLREMYARYGSELGISSTPKLFEDKGVATLTYDVLSTSQISSPLLVCASFGPVVSDGLGVAYCISKDKIIATVTAERANQTRFQTYIQALPGVMHEIKSILIQKAKLESERKKENETKAKL